MIEGTVKLNGYWYNLASKVVGAYHSRMPGKVNTGPDTFDKEQFLSNWIISDQRGGIGVDEMDESIHADRCWWTNCIIDHDGHIVSPRLATSVTAPATISPVLIDGGMETWTDVNTLTNWACTGGNGNVAQGIGGDKEEGTYSAGLNGTGTTEIIAQNVAWSTTYQGRRITVTARVKSSDAAKTFIQMYDGKTTTDSADHTGGGAFETLTCTKVLATDATQLTVRCIQEGINNAYFDTVAIAGTTLNSPFGFVNFNGELYYATDGMLSKLNAGRTAFVAINEFATDITDLLTGPNGNLLVYLGDTTVYQYMTTAEAFTATNVNDATLGILWDSKAWKMDADGNWWYSATPNAAAPAWTSQTGITDIPTQIERLGIGKDGAGDPVIYCSTNTWLKVWDFTNNKWISTEVKLYGNQHHGKGFVYWNAAHYLSYGLGVKQYSVGSTGTLSDVGLNRDGGIPAEYNGIISRLIDGGDQLFALVDASLVTGTAQSGLYAYTGRAWRCWWADPSNDGVMKDAIVSSAQSAYAVYFDCGGTIYYIDMPQGLSNPKYLTGTQKYVTGGIYLSPWFDGGNQAFQKLSKAIVSYAKGITTTETIVIKYRLNKTYTDRDTGWTTLDTLNAAGDNGELVNQIASGAGLGFNSFQFRLDFATGTSTLSADMLAMVLSYDLVPKGNWSWTMTLDIPNEETHNTTGAQKWANLKSAIESVTDIPFIFRFDTDETHFCRFLNPREIMVAGKEFSGQVTIQLLEKWLP